jgi:hypothetical protein
MDHLGPLGLEEATHDVDGGVVPVEEAGRRDEADRVGGAVEVAHEWVRGLAEMVVMGLVGGIPILYYDVELNYTGTPASVAADRVLAPP